MFTAILLNKKDDSTTDARLTQLGDAQSPVSVAPFILRGVKLIGIDSVMAAREKRLVARQKLAVDLDAGKLDKITQEIALPEALNRAPDILAGKVRGRLVANVNR